MANPEPRWVQMYQIVRRVTDSIIYADLKARANMKGCFVYNSKLYSVHTVWAAVVQAAKQQPHYTVSGVRGGVKFF